MLKFTGTVQFPKDELAHKNIVEWWYVNGFLNGQKGERFSFMNCLFKVDNKRSKLPLLSRLPVKTVYFFHSIISNLDTGEKETFVAPYCIISRDSFTKELLNINFLVESKPILFGGYVNYLLEEYALFKYNLKTEALNLNLVYNKPPLLEGGKGYLKLHDKSTYYYSLTDLTAQGTLKFKDKLYQVTGKAWMDHQWADTTYNQDRWNWFSIQLDSGLDLMCFEYISGVKSVYHTTLIYPDGKQKYTDKIEIKAEKRKWKSRRSGNSYFLDWKIKIPEENIDLTVKAILSDQEVGFNAINYWEGATKIEGKVGTHSVSGNGFMELVGEYSPWGSLAFIKNTAWEAFDKIK
ncbi:MAG: lipocalin family protein [Candidatus Magasanikbacteria bacterium]